MRPDLAQVSAHPQGPRSSRDHACPLRLIGGELVELLRVRRVLPRDVSGIRDAGVPAVRRAEPGGRRAIGPRRPQEIGQTQVSDPVPAAGTVAGTGFLLPQAATDTA